MASVSTCRPSLGSGGPLVPGLAAGAIGLIPNVAADIHVPRVVWVVLCVSGLVIAQFRVFDGVRRDRDRYKEAATACRGAGTQQLTSVQLEAAREQQRRSVLLRRLKNEYVLSHDGLTPQLLAGTAPLPKEWVNERLAALGESWRQDAYY